MKSDEYIIVYYPFPFNVKLNVGSGVRMTSILQEFINYGRDHKINILFISGNQEERLKLFKELKKIDPYKILYCYIELPNIPLLLSNKNHIPTVPLIDVTFFKYLKKNNIPFGGFLRDIYWMFDDMYPLKGIIKHVMITLNKYYLFLYKKYFNVLFLPSIKMNDYVLAPPERVYPLPSGGRRMVTNQVLKKSEGWKSIYVGSLHKTAGIKELLKAFENYNSRSQETIELIFVCRENEFIENELLFQPYKMYSWLKIMHLDSENLSSYYQSVDFAILPYSKNIYNDFAMPVKVIEYISYGLPILSTDLSAVSTFIQENECGYIVEDNYISISKGLVEIKDQISKGILKKTTILERFNQNHTWRYRVLEIDKKLREVDIRICQ